MMRRLEAIKDNSGEWAIEISDIEKKMPDLAEKDMEAGNLISLSLVMEEVNEYLPAKK